MTERGPHERPQASEEKRNYGTFAYFKMINEQGGINGRKITLISLDDAFSPPKTVEQTRRLIEKEGVSIIFGSLGPGNLAVREYLNDQHIPQIFVLAPTEAYNDPQHFPWTMGLQPTYYLDGKVHARYILAHKPDAKIAILHENEQIAREAAKGFEDGLGDKAAKLIVKKLTYEISDPTIDSQMVTLKGSGADAFYNVSSPKFAAEAIRKANELGWKPLHFLVYGSQSISAVL
jgi:branched-chain amino acid transport system substrate-binding protein